MLCAIIGRWSDDAIGNMRDSPMTALKQLPALVVLLQ